MRITGIYRFEAAHNLTLCEGGPEPVHGHSWRLEVTLEGPVRPDGMVYDFVALRRLVEDRVLSRVRSRHLNDLLDNPSAECVARWIWDRLAPDLPLVEIRLWEGPDGYVSCRGDESRGPAAAPGDRA